MDSNWGTRKVMVSYSEMPRYLWHMRMELHRTCGKVVGVGLMMQDFVE